MKLVVVLGSSRKDSQSKKVAEAVIKGAKEKGAEVVIYEENNMKVRGCVGCGSCKKNNTDCVIDDDMRSYFKDLHQCDALLLTAPNYYSQVAGHMITFMNRHYCLMTSDHASRLKPGIKLVGIFAQGAPLGIEQYLRNYDWYLKTFANYGMEIVDTLVIGGNSDLSPEGEVMKKGYELGKSLC